MTQFTVYCGPLEGAAAIIMAAFEGNNRVDRKGCCTTSRRDSNARRVPLFVSIESAGGNNRLEAGLSYTCISLSIDDAFRCDDLSRAMYKDMISHPCASFHDRPDCDQRMSINRERDKAGTL